MKDIRLTVGEKLFGGVACLICIVVSVTQAYMFVSGDESASTMARLVQIGAVVGPLLGSQVLARYVGKSIQGDEGFSLNNIACLIVILIVETFSVGISAASFDGNLLAGTRNAKLESPEYRAIQQNIHTYRSEIRSLQDHAKGLNPSYTKPRERVNEKVHALMAAIKAEEQSAAKLNVSSVDQAFNRLGESTGVTQDKMGLVVGLLLSIVPMHINLKIGTFAARIRRRRENDVEQYADEYEEEAQPVKKPRPALHAV